MRDKGRIIEPKKRRMFGNRGMNAGGWGVNEENYLWTLTIKIQTAAAISQMKKMRNQEQFSKTHSTFFSCCS